jgi:hypothetical protein
MFMNGKNGYFIRCTFMNALNVDYSPDFFISVEHFRILGKPSKNFPTKNDLFLSFCTGVFYNRDR